MYKLNIQGLRTFRTIETVNFVFYLVLIVLMVILKSFGDFYWLKAYNYILNPGTKRYYLIEATDWIPAILLILIDHNSILKNLNFQTFFQKK